uniref:Uncharacterized protein n=1 Tax=Kalanchoe fedtschenkoi TaxID=63787 RepID=A0A7N0TXC3_KALFE
MSFDSSRSASSGKQSKRSAISSQSRSGDGRSGGGTWEKRKTNQKAPGMGANFPSSSRSSFRVAPFSDFGSPATPDNANEDSGNVGNCYSYDVPETEESISKVCSPNMESTTEARDSKQAILKCDEEGGLVLVNELGLP